MAASRDEVFERIKEVLAERLSVEESDITEEANFQEDLGADSLDLVEMIMELEDQFGRTTPSRTRRGRPTVPPRTSGSSSSATASSSLPLPSRSTSGIRSYPRGGSQRSARTSSPERAVRSLPASSGSATG
jgi:acyl carrier protein